jgi:hypothetical protein
MNNNNFDASMDVDQDVADWLDSLMPNANRAKAANSRSTFYYF